jgi:sugar phosphate isomerase/epimerase
MNEKPPVGLSLCNLQAMFGDEKALHMAQQAGADAVDLNLLDYDDTLYRKSEDEICSYLTKLAGLANSLGLIIRQTHGRIIGYRNIPELDEEQKRLARLDMLATRTLGAQACAVHGPSRIRLGLEEDPALLRELTFRNFADFLPFAREAGVKIAMETLGDVTETYDKTGRNCLDFLGNSQEFISIYRRLKEETPCGDALCVCLDSGHTNGAYSFPGQPSPAEMVRKLGKNIEILHLHDNDGITDQHKIPGSGSIDWKELITALRETGYNGVYNMELKLFHFGCSPEIMTDYAAFAVKVMRNMLEEYQ